MPSTATGRRVLITGGAGFIGSHLVEALAPTDQVTVFDNHHRDALSAVRGLGDAVSVIRGDVLDPAGVAAAIAGHDVVIHLAAIAGISSVDRDAARTMRINFLGSLNVLEAAAAAGASRCVLFSTSEIYGRRAFRVTEDEPATIPPPTDGRWAYAASKLAAEHLGMSFHRAGALPVTIVRPFNVYGPRQVGEGAIHDMTAAVVARRPIRVRGDGLAVRSWCYISDFVDAVLGAVAAAAAAGEVINIGNPEATVNSLTLAETVARVAGGGVRIERVPASGPDVELRMPPIDQATRLLGFVPQVGIEEGVRRTLEWTRSASAADGEVARA